MEVYILINEYEGCGNADTIGVYTDATKAKKAFNAYLDALEVEWREKDGKIDEHNTFNRFCEPHDNAILMAMCDVSVVSVRKHTVE